MESLKRLFRCLIRPWSPESSREAGDAVVENLALHWFPAKVTRRSLSWRYSLWLGTISFSLFLFLTVTGVVLMFLYVPSVERAYWSIKDLEYTVSFGAFLRSCHRIGAHLMVVFVFLHLCRAFFTGAYKNGTSPRANRPLNWILGVVLLILTLGLSFTGYLLPWDQLAFWAITVGTNIASAAPLVGEASREFLLGGSIIGQNTLIRFYVLHCVFLPGILFGVAFWHMWRIRKDGGLAVVEQYHENASPPEEGEPTGTPSYALLGVAKGTSVHVHNAAVLDEKDCLAASPNLTRRIWAVCLTTVVITAALALIFPAPLEGPANPSVTPNPAKAPWYFLWLQEIVTDTTFTLGGITINGALIGGVLLPGLIVIGLMAWPFLDRSGSQAVGIWFARTRLRHNILFILFILFIIVFTVIGTYLRGPNWEFFWPWESWPEMPTKI